MYAGDDAIKETFEVHSLADMHYLGRQPATHVDSANHSNRLYVPNHALVNLSNNPLIVSATNVNNF